MVVIDCGLTFPKNDQMGVDIVLPDFSYLLERRRRPRGDHPDPRPRGPHRRGPVPAARRGPGAGLRPPLHARPAAAQAGRARPGGERRADRGALRARGRGRARSTPSSSPSRTRCRTARPWRCAPRRARSCTPATSASSSTRSTAASAPSRTSCAWATAACGCCWPTRPTPRRATSRSRSPTTPSRTGSRRSSPRPAGGCSSRPSRRTSTACSRCWRPRTSTAASSPWWAAR